MTDQDLFALAPTLETARLLLRQITLGDADAIFAFQSDPEVLRYYRSEAFTRLEQTQEYLQRAIEAQQRHERLGWAIILKGSQQLIGRIHLGDWSVRDHRAEANYMLARAYWGQGYMSEALNALLAFAFQQTDLNRIEAYCWSKNVGSARVLEKAGMQLEGMARQRLFCKGHYRSIKTYAILKEDYV